MLILILILVIGAVVRLPLVTMALPFYNSDTAVLDLMTRHFLHGEFSLYYWGFHYYGVLDQILLMPLFRWFGASPHVSQILPFTFSIVLLFSYHRYIKKIEGSKTAHLATLVLAVASPAFLRYTFTTYNYVFGPLLGLLFMQLASEAWTRPDDRKLCFMLGLVCGFARYYFGLILFFWAAVGIAWWMAYRSQGKFISEESWTISLIWNRIILLKNHSMPPLLKRLLVFANLINLANLCMAIVLWFHGDFAHTFGTVTVKIPFSSTFEFSMQAAVMTAAVAEWPRLKRAGIALWNRTGGRAFILGFGLGYLPALIGCFMGNFPNVPSGFVPLPQLCTNLKWIFGTIAPHWASQSNYPVLAAAAVFVLGGGLYFLLQRFVQLLKLARQRKPAPSWAPMVFLFAINLFVGLFYMRLGDIGNSRYFLPAYLSLALGAAYFVNGIARYSRLAAYGLFSLLLANNLAGDVALVQNNRTPRPFALLADELLARGCHGGYADYFVGYRLAALSNERLIFASPGEGNLYPPYLKYVQSLDRPIMIEEPGIHTETMTKVNGTAYRIVRREILAGTPVAWLEKVL